MIEVCLVVYQRFQRVPEILRQLKAQTIQDFRVNIWNNSGEELDIGDFPKGRISIIDSKENVGSQARFRLAKQTTGNPIIFFDDDEDLRSDFVEYHYSQYLKFGPEYILGWFTKTFDKESYWKNQGANYGQEVDYIGAGGMILDRAIFDKEPLLQNIPEPFSKTEDLYLSYLARMRYGMKLIKIEPACKILVDGKDQYKTIDKEKIFKELREKGWWLLEDGTKNFGGFNFKIRKGQWDEAILAGESRPEYYQIPQNPKVVVDIGAHIGGTTILCANRGAKVYAYEPEPENFNLLLENIKINGVEDRIDCFQKGVGIPGTREVYLNPKNSGMATFERISNEKEEVNIIGIKEVFENISHCDLLKMDCEGAEYEFIFDTPFEKIDQVSMELHKGEQENVIRYLKKFYTVQSRPASDKTSLIVFCHKPLCEKKNE